MWDVKIHTFCASLPRFIQVLLSQTSLYLIFIIFLSCSFQIPDEPVKWLVITGIYVYFYFYVITSPSRLSWWLLIIININSKCTVQCSACWKHHPSLLPFTVTPPLPPPREARVRQQPTVSQAWEFSLSSVSEGEQKMPPQICHFGIRLIWS